MTEDELQEALIAAAWASGWLIHHDRPALKADGSYTTAIEGHPGFPDLVLVHRRNPEVIVAELKGDDGRVTSTQRHWLDRFHAAGILTRLWTPANYDQALDEITGNT